MVGKVRIRAGTFELGFVWMSTRIVVVDSTVILRLIH